MATRQVTEAIQMVRRTTRGGDDQALRETRRILREAGPAAAKFLPDAIEIEGLVSTFGSLRAALAVLRYGYGAEAGAMFAVGEAGHGGGDGDDDAA